MRYKVFYCFSLNRRNTAYMYVGQSIRIADLLRLGVPRSQPVCNDVSDNRIMNEHRKRIWWTTYCLDLMVCTEIGLTPSHETNENGLEYPSDEAVKEVENQFFDAQLLKAHAELCQVRGQVIRTVTNQFEISRLEHPNEFFGPFLERIRNWRAKLPANLSYTFEHGIPEPMLRSPLVRSIASLYLRYYQVLRRDTS